MSIKRRILLFIPLLVFVFVTSTTFLAPKPAYAAPSDEPGISCGGVSLNPFNLSWMVCPIVEGMKGAVIAMDNFINSQLTVGTPGDSSDPNQIFCNSDSDANAKKSCKAYYSAWLSFRNIALGLLVATGVIVLISQALGFELLDAYTIRKVLPRFLIAAVGITLSWQLMQFFVTLCNDLAFGVRFLIYQPFAGIPDLSLGGNSQLAGGLLAITGLALLGWLGLISFIGTALLAVFIAFLVLVLRQLVIILLITIAPIAIIAYVLPNTQKIYKLWWDSFSKALLMFVLISGLIATGRVFASVASLNSDNTLNELAGFSAYFLPYFLIPFTFKFAGGALRQIGGFVNDRSKGGFDRLRQFRGNQTKKNLGRLGDGTRLSGTNYEGRVTGKYSAFARQFNRGTKGTNNFARNAGYDPRKWKDRMAAAKSAESDVAIREAREKNPYLQALDGDDDLLQVAIEAVQQKKGENWMRQQLIAREYQGVDEGIGMIRKAKNSMNDEVFQQAAIPMLFGSKSGLTPKYKLDEFGERVKDANGNDILISGGDNGAAVGRAMIVDAARRADGSVDQQRLIRLLGAARSEAERTGRTDLVGGSYTEDVAMTQAMGAGRIGDIHSAYAQNEVTNKVLDGALDGNSRGRIMAGHKRSVEALAKRMKIRTRNAAVVQNKIIPTDAMSAEQRQAIIEREAPQAEDAFSLYASLGASIEAASGSAPEMIDIIKKEVLDEVINVETLPEQIKAEMGPARFGTKRVRKATPDGGVVEVIEPDYDKPVLTMTNAEINEALRNYSPTYGRYKREYSRGSDAFAASQGGPPTVDPAGGGGTPAPGGAAAG